MRFARLALLLVLLMMFALVPMGASSSSPPSEATAAAKLAKCKIGKANKKKCRCPEGYKRVKRKNREGKKVFRCKKIKAPAPAPGPDPDPDPDPDPTPDPNSGPNSDPDPNPVDSGPTPEQIFADVLSRTYLLRNYQPSPSANHSEEYAFCNDSTHGMRMWHKYEGIAFIYESTGPWRVLSGTASADGSTGSGRFEYTQQTANFDEEVGKVQVIDIAWNGDIATVAHPEIGTYNFAKTVSSSSSCTRTT